MSWITSMGMTRIFKPGQANRNLFLSDFQIPFSSLSDSPDNLLTVSWYNKLSSLWWPTKFSKSTVCHLASYLAEPWKAPSNVQERMCHQKIGGMPSSLMQSLVWYIHRSCFDSTSHICIIVGVESVSLCKASPQRLGDVDRGAGKCEGVPRPWEMQLCCKVLSVWNLCAIVCVLGNHRQVSHSWLQEVIWL